MSQPRDRGIIPVLARRRPAHCAVYACAVRLRLAVVSGEAREGEGERKKAFRLEAADVLTSQSFFLRSWEGTSPATRIQTEN